MDHQDIKQCQNLIYIQIQIKILDFKIKDRYNQLQENLFLLILN